MEGQPPREVVQGLWQGKFAIRIITERGIDRLINYACAFAEKKKDIGVPGQDQSGNKIERSAKSPVGSFKGGSRMS